MEIFIYHLPIYSYYYLQFTIATIYFRCSNTLRDVDHDAVVSGDLENVCLSFGSFRLSFTVSELLLFPIYGGCYLFPFLQYVVRRRLNYQCVGRPGKCMFSIWNFSPITCRCRLAITSGRRRPHLISVNHVGLLTFSFAGRQGAENTTSVVGMRQI
jgi:hypothetical protein